MAPMAGVGTFMTPYPGQEVMDDGDKGMLMFSVEQQIPNPAKQRAKKELYGSRAAIEQAAQEVTYNQLRAEAKNLYYQWLVLEKKMAVLKENASIMEMMKKLAEIRYPYSQGSLGNIYKAEGRLYEVQNMILMTQSDIEQKNIMLNTLMNIPIDVRYQIDTSAVNIDPLLISIDTAQLADRRSDILRLENTINTMRLNTTLMSFEAKPDFSIRFDHMQPYGSMMPKQFTAMAMVSIPIAPWSSKMYKSQVRGMNYEIEAMRAERESILNETRGMLYSMAAEIRKMQQQLTNYDTKIIPALQKNYQTVMLAYEENNEELPIVVDAWEALNMAQMEYLDKMENYYLMIVDYEKELER
jgi:outer membrane protein TolC